MLLVSSLFFFSLTFHLSSLPHCLPCGSHICSPVLVIEQIQTPVRSQFIPIRLAKAKDTIVSRVGQDLEPLQYQYIVGGSIN